MIKLCNCGSGLHRYDLTDAAGIFCKYVCNQCEERETSRYRPSVFATGTAYSSSGDEADIDAGNDI